MLLVQQVPQVPKVQQEVQVLMVHRVHKDIRVQQDLVEPLVPKVMRVPQVPKVQQVLRVHHLIDQNITILPVVDKQRSQQHTLTQVM